MLLCELYADSSQGTVAMMFLICHSPSPIRHAYYETFLFLHICGAIVALVGLYVHLTVKYYSWASYCRAAMCIWAFDRACRLLRIIYRNVGKRITTATIEVLPGEACRVTIVSFGFPNENCARANFISVETGPPMEI